ncbi:hypothetical protein GGR32_000058 [Mesonia hippocampi]|uniref:6-phosphogluconate dehydrogenase n=1 Tax=Mesonia hippocampi TaxID=1628250 RepID=A0A840ER16_9FLAO|nr:6-phosphogluconate dehydrogenase [Mesonia hippocampi]MBB4117786.1 hypothetical protein [Mesonia hippocampi]
MKKILLVIISCIAILAIAYYSFIYFIPYSEGNRAGELIKFSHKGAVIKTWEGQISQGISGAHMFNFSVLDKDKNVIEKLKELQGEYVELTYIERFGTFVFWGDSHYFVTDVKKSRSPHFKK